MDDKEILLTEWKEVREGLRYFGNKRFAQLTVFLAAEGATLNGFLNSAEGADYGYLLPVTGIFLCFIFFIMEYSSVVYWRTFAARGEAIEKQLPPLELMTNYRPPERGLNCATRATYLLYLCAAALWVFLAWPAR